MQNPTTHFLAAQGIVGGGPRRSQSRGDVVGGAPRRSHSRGEHQDDFCSPKETLIVFDWDDTLCPSYWIQENHPALSFFQPPPNRKRYIEPLSRLEHAVVALLESSMRRGKVIIVTNAESPWVETSCKFFLPGLRSYINKIPVVYAQSRHQTLKDKTPRTLQRTNSSLNQGKPGMYKQGSRRRGDNSGTFGTRTFESSMSLGSYNELAPQVWKETAFHEELCNFYSQYNGQSWKNVVCIGDSIFERDAMRNVVSKRPTKGHRCRLKTVKLLDEPDIDELISQVQLLHEAMYSMVVYDKNLDIEFDEDDLQRVQQRASPATS